jgi:hypothetical protein
MVELKQCRECKCLKDNTGENFVVSHNKITSWCRVCKRAYQIIYNKTPAGIQSQKKYELTEKGKNTNLKGTKNYCYKLKGVYGIFDNNNVCLYIGRSSQFNGRVMAHKHAINNLDQAAKHRSSMLFLYQELAKCKSVRFELLQECEKSELNDVESFYIDKYKPIYNIYKNENK